MFKRIQRAKRENDWATFETEAMPYLSELFRVAMWLVRDRAEAEDLVQETFTQALESFHRYQPGTNCRAWLVTIMYHMNSKRRRLRGRLHLVSDTEERIAETIAFEPSTPQDIAEEEVLHALGRIPRSYQEVVVLSDVEDLTYKEMADALGIPVGTVMSRLHRGRKLLRTELAGYANAQGIGRRATDEQASAPRERKQ